MNYYIETPGKVKIGPFGKNELYDRWEHGEISENSRIFWNNFKSFAVADKFFHIDESNENANSMHSTQENTKREQHKQSSKNPKQIDVKCRHCKIVKRVTIDCILIFERCVACGQVFDIRDMNGEISIDWIENKKSQNDPKNLPINVKKALSFFEIELITIDFSILKRKYKEKLTEYHPDKTSALGKKLQDLAHETTIEINDNYETLMEYFCDIR